MAEESSVPRILKKQFVRGGDVLNVPGQATSTGVRFPHGHYPPAIQNASHVGSENRNENRNHSQPRIRRTSFRETDKPKFANDTRSGFQPEPTDTSDETYRIRSPSVKRPVIEPHPEQGEFHQGPVDDVGRRESLSKRDDFTKRATQHEEGERQGSIEGRRAPSRVPSSSDLLTRHDDNLKGEIQRIICPDIQLYHHRENLQLPG